MPSCCGDTHTPPAFLQRWDGARKMWGLVLNRSRDVVRQGLAWIPAERAGLRDMLCRWVPAFSKALVRGPDNSFT